MNKQILPILCISLLTACVSNTVKDTQSIEQSAIQQAKKSDLNPQTVINDSQALQLQAQREDLYFFSPSYMEQAETALTDAINANEEKQASHEILALGLTSQKLFKRGLENKQLVTKQLKASFNGLVMLQEINSDKVLTSDYQDIKNEIKELIILIEQGKTAKALTEEKSILLEITELEINTLKKSYLNPVKNALEKAEDADAEDFAEKSFTEAEKAIEKFELYISNNAKQREIIKQKSTEMLHKALRSEHIAKAAKPLINLTPETAEDHIVFIETLLNRISISLNNDNLNHLNLNSQSIAIAQTAETLNKKANTQSNIVGETDALNTKNAALQKEILELKAKIISLKPMKQAELAPVNPDTDKKHLDNSEAPSGEGINTDLSADNKDMSDTSMDKALPGDLPVDNTAQLEGNATEAETPATAETKETVIETPTTEKPAVKEAALEETAPIIKETVIETAAPEEAVTEEVVTEEVVTEEVVTEETVTEEVVTEETVTEETVTEAIIAKDPTTEASL